jgi:hypothetical protein
MPGGVKEDPERRAGLKLGLASPERDHLLLTDVEVGAVKVEMHLLRTVGAGQSGGW